jgi:hypothetical protein
LGSYLEAKIAKKLHKAADNLGNTHNYASPKED